jgi:tRNA 2-thiouridine synthesizing protein B
MSDILSSIENWHGEGDDSKRVIFLLTKPPNSERTKLCFRLIEQSNNPVLYLAGDGVYNLVCSSIDNLAHGRIYACVEDMEARGIQSDDAVILPVDFYGQLVKDAMLCSHRLFTF